MLGRSCSCVAVDKLQSEEYLRQVVALVGSIIAFSTDHDGAIRGLLQWGICDAHVGTACVSSERLAIPPEALAYVAYVDPSLRRRMSCMMKPIGSIA